jgi:hypothetical protein
MLSSLVRMATISFLSSGSLVGLVTFSIIRGVTVWLIAPLAGMAVLLFGQGLISCAQMITEAIVKKR